MVNGFLDLAQGRAEGTYDRVGTEKLNAREAPM